MKRSLLLLCATVCWIAASRSSSAQSFSVDSISPTVQVSGGFADDVYNPVPGGIPPVFPAPFIGLPGAGLNNLENDGFSYGRPLNAFSKTAPAYFSVDLGAHGLAGTAVSVEFNASGGSEASSDVFFSNYIGGNALRFDGDGLATAPNPAAPPLGVAEAGSYPVPMPIPPSLTGDVDGLDLRNVVMGPTTGPSSPTGVIFFSLLNTSAYGPGFSPGDIFVAPGVPGYSVPSGPSLPPVSPGVPQPYANEAALGMLPPLVGNDIDALVVFDNGDNIYQPGSDIILFSLRSGSPYLSAFDPITGVQFSPGDILIDGTSAMALLGSATPVPAILHTAESLGLHTIRSGSQQNDELNALDVFVPEPNAGLLATLAAIGLLAFRCRRVQRRGPEVRGPSTEPAG
jgi:hypothetical protein